MLMSVATHPHPLHALQDEVERYEWDKDTIDLVGLSAFRVVVIWTALYIVSFVLGVGMCACMRMHVRVDVRMDVLD